MSARFNPPPNWPAPPAGWTPPQGWTPDPAWGPAPQGWELWVEDPGAPGPGYGSPAGAAPAGLAMPGGDSPKKPWYKKKRFLIPIVLLLLIIIWPKGGNDDEPTGAPPAATQEPAEEAPAEEAPTEEAPAEEAAPEEAPAEEAPAAPPFAGAQDDDVIGNAGDALALDDVTVTTTALIASNVEFVGPVICTTATLNNTSDEAVDFNIFEWELQDPTGTIRNVGFSGSDNMLSSAGVAPGGTATGDVCFDGEMPAGQYVLFYEPFSFFDSRAAWISNVA